MSNIAGLDQFFRYAELTPLNRCIQPLYLQLHGWHPIRYFLRSVYFMPLREIMLILSLDIVKLAILLKISISIKLLVAIMAKNMTTVIFAIKDIL